MNNDRFKFRTPGFFRGEFVGFMYYEVECGAIKNVINPSMMVDIFGDDEQCTGLRDKKGTLIYENDIVFYYGYEKPIEWHNGFYIVAGAGTMTKLVRDGMCEIIGNVHETEE